MTTRRWCGLASAVLLGAALVSCSPKAEPEMPAAPTADADTAREMIAAANDEAWEQLSSMFPGVERPEVEQIRVVGTAEWGKVLTRCIEEQGFPASATSDGGISYGTIPEEQAEAQNIAVYICRVQYPTDPSALLPLTADEVSFLYEFYKSELVPCLTSRGYEVEMPSESVFRDRLKTEGSPWAPYQEIPEVGGAALETLLVECPQIPSGFRGAS